MSTSTTRKEKNGILHKAVPAQAQQGHVEALIEFTDADLDKLKKLDEAFDRGNWPRDLPPDHASVYGYISTHQGVTTMELRSRFPEIPAWKIGAIVRDLRTGGHVKVVDTVVIERGHPYNVLAAA